MATLSDYTYGDLRTEIYEEFGFGSERDLFVARRVSRALHWLARHRAMWPWLLKPFTINVQPSSAGDVDVTQDSASVTVNSGTPVQRGYMVNGTFNGDITDPGYMIKTWTGSSPMTLDANWIAASENSKTVTFVQAIYALPADCSMVHLLVDPSEPRSRMEYMLQHDFERMRLDQTLGIQDRYTVIPDPTGVDTESPYLHLFPYPTSRRTLRGLYFFTMNNMDTSTDVSFIPRRHRPILIDAASWFIATSLGDPRADEYKLRTAVALQEMAEQETFSNDEINPYPDHWPIFLEGDGVDGGDGPGLMPSFNG